MIKPDRKNTVSTRNLQSKANGVPPGLGALAVLCIIQQFMLTDVPESARND